MFLHKTIEKINGKIQVEMPKIRLPFHYLVDVLNQEFEAFIMPGSSTDIIGLLIPLQPLWMKDSEKMNNIASCKQMAQQHNMIVNKILGDQTQQKKLIVLKFPTSERVQILFVTFLHVFFVTEI